MKKRWALFATGMAFVMMLGACASQTKEDKNSKIEQEESTALSEEENTGMPNPFIDCDTLEDAADIAGFTMEAPDSLEGYDNKLIQAVKDDMIQVMFYNGNLDTDEDLVRVILRKGTGDEDISGDYNEYSETEEVDVEGRSVTLKGEEDGVYTATWTDQDYSFAISFDEPADKDIAIETAKSMN